VVVDAIFIPEHEPGEIMRLKVEDFSHTVHGSSPHGVNISTAIALGMQTTPDRMPKEIVFWAMQAEDISTFCETQTEEVARKMPELIAAVVAEIGR
jgi:hydrogenase maturation protease